MEKLIKNEWHREDGKPYERACILRHDFHPEGLDIERIRFIESGEMIPDANRGHILSISKGSCCMFLNGDLDKCFQIHSGMHLYIPPGIKVLFDVERMTDFVHVSAPTASQARGKDLILRDETFLAACASGSQSLRWIFTPQYLSRRIFLHHDPTLLSKSGHPISWFHTTMFDVTGLAENEEKKPVFKMSYNSRTEVNVCYDVKGISCVRMARHPYRKFNQTWDPWLTLDDDSTYHLNESAGGLEEECLVDEKSQSKQYFRNKHEVYIADGHVSLFCLFDPAPIGIERHKPGEYSDYEDLTHVLGSEVYNIHRQEIKRFDEMMDQLSVAKAIGNMNGLHSMPVWQLYLQGRDAQMAIEEELIKTLITEDKGRKEVIAKWMLSK
jgi:hypothetical protein